jgi:hypothetical protein
MTIRFLKTPEANVPSGLSMFVDTDGTPKLKQPDGSVAQLLRITPDKVVLGTGDPVEVADATALFGKEYDGVVELAIKRGTLPAVRITQGAGLVPRASNYFPGSTQTADLTLAVPASPTTDFVLAGVTVSPPGSGVSWCVYQCHLELVSLNENYQTQTTPPDYDDMRGLTISGDFALLFDDSVGTPDLRYANGGPLVPAAIVVPLAGTPIVSTQINPSEVLVDNLGVLRLRVTNSGAQKYWIVLRLTVSPPLPIQGPP